MFDQKAVRVSAGLLFGGTGFLILAALLYQRTWSRNAEVAEHEQLLLLLRHLMWGVGVGMCVGAIAALTRFPLWTGGGSFVLAGLGTAGSSILARYLGSVLAADVAVLGLAVAGAFVGSALGARWTSPGRKGEGGADSRDPGS